MPTVTVRDVEGREVEIPYNPDPALGTDLQAVRDAVQGKGLSASGATPVSGALTSGQASAAFTPAAGRTAFLELTGAGSGPVTLVYECADGSTFAPRGVATDGGAPIILGKVAYAGSPIILAFETSIVDQGVKALAGTITGSITATFRQ